MKILGCKIQANAGAAIKLCKPKRGADCDIYIKSRKHEIDIIGDILIGSNPKTTASRMKIDPNLPQLLRDLNKVQVLKIYVEMIQMSRVEESKDGTASVSDA